ncbi:MAG TPA: hypothetical protein V6C91_02550, partial [Coleofasciculaceae cyanobacterium]
MPFRQLGKKTLAGLIVGAAVAIAAGIALTSMLASSIATSTHSEPGAPSLAQHNGTRGQILIQPQYEWAENFS